MYMVSSEQTFLKYNGTSLLRSPTGLGKSDLNGEVTLLQRVICTVHQKRISWCSQTKAAMIHILYA